jgi:copper(I)-binding protein
VVAVGALALVACGDDDDSGDSLTVTDPWARTSPMAVDVGAGYLRIESADGDQLVGVSVDPSVAGRVEIHETVMADGEMTATTMAEGDMTATTMAGDEMAEEGGDMGDMGGAMTMRAIPALDLPAGETVSLEPGGYHIMLLELPEPLELGDTFDATLEFAEADPVTVTFEVRDEAP